MKSSQIELHGITWDHSRALPPLAATAQRFEELNPGVRVHWHKRSLHEFGHANVAELADRFDLVVIDHPWAGFALERAAFVNLFDHFDAAILKELQTNSVGQCMESYLYDGRWLAVPIDAASPAASYRPDLLPQSDVPQSWEQLIALASTGRIILPAFHVDLLLHLVMLAATLDEKAIFGGGDEWCDGHALDDAMNLLAALMARVPAECYDMNPITVYESMSQRSEQAYCPFAYTYSNYARAGYARHRLRFLDPVELPQRGMLRGVLGGTGLAISAQCAAIEQALQFLRFTVAPELQRTIYTHAGGQPARREAWENALNNELTDSFFRSTASSIERAYLRPRYDGFIQFQEQAGKPLTRWLRGEMPRKTAADQMNAIYRQSRKIVEPCQ